MLCPHCQVGVRLQFEVLGTWSSEPDEKMAQGYALAYEHCPECGRLIVLLQRGPVHRYEQEEFEPLTYDMPHVRETKTIYPSSGERRPPPEVPEPHRSDFVEATAVLPLSPKASAALSRRILQGVLRQNFGIKKATLAQEVDAFLKQAGTPSYLREALDAVRNVGNLAAHPELDAVGAIVDVEPGEAEWLVETIESLFDFAYVQPAHLEQRRTELNAKLKALGKPELKG